MNPTIRMPTINAVPSHLFTIPQPGDNRNSDRGVWNTRTEVALDSPTMAIRTTPRIGRSFYLYLKRGGARDRSFEDPKELEGERRYSVSTRATQNGNSVHIQFYARGPWMYIYGHVEPDTLARTLAHLRAWRSGAEVHYGLGRQIVRVMFRSWSGG